MGLINIFVVVMLVMATVVLAYPGGSARGSKGRATPAGPKTSGKSASKAPLDWANYKGPAPKNEIDGLLQANQKLLTWCPRKPSKNPTCATDVYGTILKTLATKVANGWVPNEEGQPLTICGKTVAQTYPACGVGCLDYECYGKRGPGGLAI